MLKCNRSQTVPINRNNYKSLFCYPNYLSPLKYNYSNKRKYYECKNKLSKNRVRIKKTVIYARVSVESIYTKKESISNQIDYLLKYAKNNNFKIIDIYQDDGKTGANLERDGIKKLFSDMNKIYRRKFKRI